MVTDAQHRRVRSIGIAALLAGLTTLALAFPTLADATSSAATASSSCAPNGWTATITVRNSPNATLGAATITGTGTALDGTTLAAGGGQRTLQLAEPFSVATVTIAGTMSWASGYHAPFLVTATEPTGCRVGLLTPAVAGTSDNVTLCHATDSDHNPYVQITVDSAGAYNGHLGHTGPVWSPDLAKHVKWGDIIPPFTFDGQTYSLNWDAAGQAIWNDGCAAGSPVTTTATVTATTTTTVTDPAVTVTVPGPTTTVTAPGPTVTLTEPAITETVTVTAPAQTNTLTDTEAGPTETVTVTEPAQTSTVTVTATQTIVGQSSTVTETVTVTPPTVTETQVGPTTTVTTTETAAVAGISTQAEPTRTVAVVAVSCPPGAAVEGGSLAFTGSGGNNALMSMVGGALTVGGAMLLLLGRRRRLPRSH
jgi:hypothetical protein